MKKKIISLTLITALILTSTAYAAPKEKKDNNGKGKATVTTTNTAEQDDQDTSAPLTQDQQDNPVPLTKEQKKALRETLKQTKNQVETQKDAAEEVKNQLEIQYEAAVEAGDTELAAELQIQLQEAANAFNNIKIEFKNMIQTKKQLIKSSYTEEELDLLQQSIDNILESASEDTAILDVDSIFSDSADFKFDSPPVIKSGRTIIPVRAITKGFGAELSWYPETQQVDISKDDITINLTIGSNTAIVNGEEVLLDSRAEIMNSRTYVPLRFILETFGLNVKWDDDTDTIEIEDPDEKTDETRTDSAIEL